MAGKYSCGEKPASLKKNPQIRENISPREYFPARIFPRENISLYSKQCYHCFYFIDRLCRLLSIFRPGQDAKLIVFSLKNNKKDLKKKKKKKKKKKE